MLQACGAGSSNPFAKCPAKSPAPQTALAAGSPLLPTTTGAGLSPPPVNAGGLGLSDPNTSPPPLRSPSPGGLGLSDHGNSAVPLRSPSPGGFGLADPNSPLPLRSPSPQGFGLVDPNSPLPLRSPSPGGFGLADPNSALTAGTASASPAGASQGTELRQFAEGASVVGTTAQSPAVSDTTQPSTNVASQRLMATVAYDGVPSPTPVPSPANTGDYSCGLAYLHAMFPSRVTRCFENCS